MKVGAAFDRAAKSKRTSLLLCLMAGAMGALPYYIEELFLFTFLSLFILFYTVIKQREERNRIFVPFFWYYYGFFTPLYLFLSEMYPYTRFGFNEEQAVFILICSCIAIPLLHTVVEAGLMLIARSFRCKKFEFLGFAALFTVGEWILTLGTLAFPWSGISVSLTGFLPYLQTASLFGKYFLTFITVAACYALASSAETKKRFFALLGTGIICVNLLIGSILMLVPYEKGDKITASALQGNVLSNEKWNSENRESIFEIYTGLAADAAENGAKIILLPETAIPQRFVEGGSIHNALAKIAVEYDTTIVCGVHYYIDEQNFNAVIAILPDGSLSDRYDKRHLVPFGEFIPFAKTLGEMFPFIAEFNEGTSDLTEGSEPIVFKTEIGNIASLVCFDSIFPQFSREAVMNGAKYIAIVTNDSWFNDSVGIYTHLRHAKLRAIENRRYVMRAANTGISAFIDEKGRIITQTEALTLDTASAEVYAIDSNTLYYYVGDIFLYGSFITLICFVFYSIFDKLRRKFNGNHPTSPDRDL